MAWSTPSTHVLGYVVTPTDWNEVVNDLRFLKGLDGAVAIEDFVSIAKTGAGVQNQLGLINTQAAAADVGGQIYIGRAVGTAIGQMRAAWDDANATDGYLAFWTRQANAMAEVLRLTSDGVSVFAGNVQLSDTEKLTSTSYPLYTYLGFSAAGGSVKLHAAADMYFRIDSDNGGTGMNFLWEHNAGTQLAELNDNGLFGLTVGPLGLLDGIAEPAHNATYAQIYVDVADGDLKIKFKDDFIRVIAADS